MLCSKVWKRFSNNGAILDFIKHNQRISHSSVFQGTLYEHTVMRELNEKLHIKDLQRIGGSNDHGIDIRGRWPLDLIFNRANTIVSLEKAPKRDRVHGIALKPLKRKLEEKAGQVEPLKIIVQCKAFNFSKVSPKEFRELIGTFSSNVSHTQRNSTIIMMCSPNLLTKEGLNLINAVKLPLVYLRVEMLKQAGENYDLMNSGRLLNYYENDYAATLLQGCGIKEWLNLSMYKV